MLHLLRLLRYIRAKKSRKLAFFLAIPLFFVSWYIAHYSMQISIDKPLDFLINLGSVVFTAILGFLAYWQSQIAQKMNTRLMAIEGKRDRIETEPRILITEWMGRVITGNDSLKCSTTEIMSDAELVRFDSSPDYSLYIKFTNTTKAIIHIYLGSVYTVEDNDRYESNREYWHETTSIKKKNIFMLHPGSCKWYGLWNHLSKIEKRSVGSIHMVFVMTNFLGERYFEDISFSVNSMLYDPNNKQPKTCLNDNTLDLEYFRYNVVGSNPNIV